MKAKKVDPKFTSNVSGEKVGRWHRCYRCVCCDAKVSKKRITHYDGLCLYCETDLAMNPEL